MNQKTKLNKIKNKKNNLNKIYKKQKIYKKKIKNVNKQKMNNTKKF